MWQGNLCVQDYKNKKDSEIYGRCDQWIKNYLTHSLLP